MVKVDQIQNYVGGGDQFFYYYTLLERWNPWSAMEANLFEACLRKKVFYKKKRKEGVSMLDLSPHDIIKLAS